ncbi:MAG: PIG-L deacetylase family protein [Candidatus Aquicultorales bacterium]
MAWILRFIALGLIAAAGVFVLNNLMAYQISWNKFREVVPAELPPIPRDATVVIVAPHPDDETLSLGGWLSDAAGRGAKVYAVLVTNGDAFTLQAKQFLRRFEVGPKDYLENGVLRQRESLEATGILGYGLVTFLGFPDQGTREIWESHWDDAYTSKTTKEDKVPYRRSFKRWAPYEGRVLKDQLSELFVRYQPDILVMPSRFETHPDHYAASLFSTMAVMDPRIKKRPTIVEYIVHRGGYPYPYGLHPYAFLPPPEGLLNVGLDWRSYTLDDDAKANKAGALLQYKSQFFFAGYDIAGFYRRNEVASRGGNIYSVIDLDRTGFSSEEIDGLPPGSRDPIGDTAERLLEPSGDITMIRVVKADRAVVLVTLNEAVNRFIRYRINVRNIEGGDLVKTETIDSIDDGERVRVIGKNIEVALGREFAPPGSSTFVEVTTSSAVGEIDLAAGFFEERK